MNPTPFTPDPHNPLTCPSCGQQIIQAAGVTPGHSGTIRKGGLFVCVSCGYVSVVGDSNLEKLSKKQFDALPPHVQGALDGILRTLKDQSVTDTELN